MEPIGTSCPGRNDMITSTLLSAALSSVDSSLTSRGCDRMLAVTSLRTGSGQLLRRAIVSVLTEQDSLAVREALEGLEDTIADPCRCRANDLAQTELVGLHQ